MAPQPLNLELIESSDLAASTSPYILSVGLELPEAANQEALGFVPADCNGLRIQKPGDRAIYLVDRGQKRHIPDPDTFNNLFANWSHNEEMYIFDSIETGIPLPSGGYISSSNRIRHGLFARLELQKTRHGAICNEEIQL
jgi:hypothetical protein